MKIASAFSVVSIVSTLCIHSLVLAERLDPPQPFNPPESFRVHVQTGEAANEQQTVQELVRSRDLSEPGVLMFLTTVNDEVLRISQLLDLVVAQNVRKGARGAVVYVARQPDRRVIQTLKEARRERIPMAVYDGEGNPGYEISRTEPVTILMWKDRRIYYVHVLSGEELRQKDTGKKILVDFLGLLN